MTSTGGPSAAPSLFPDPLNTDLTLRISERSPNNPLNR